MGAEFNKAKVKLVGVKKRRNFTGPFHGFLQGNDNLKEGIYGL